MKQIKLIFCCVLGLALLTGITACQASQAPQKVEIHDIQGCAHISPLQGQHVKEVSGIVTRKMDTGFVIQSDTPDDQPCSSEAIFVFTNNLSSVVTGDRVAVSGIVSEFTPGNADEYNLSQTEITEAEVQVLGGSATLPSPVLLGEDGYASPRNVIEDDEMRIFDPQSDGLDYYESLEWMRVELPTMTVVGPRNVFNEIVTAEKTGLKASTPRAAAALVEEGSAYHPERLMIALPGNWTRKINQGDELQAGLIGIMTYSYGNYKVIPVTQINITGFKEEETDNRTINAQRLRIATFNLNNFSQYSSKTKKEGLASQIADDLQSPDLLVLQEVMDDSGTLDDGVTAAVENLTSLTDEIRKAGGGEYVYFDMPPENNRSGGVAGGNIRTVFLLNKASPLKLKSVVGEGNQNLTLKIPSDGLVSITPNPGLIGFDEQGFEDSRKPIVGVFDYGGRQIVVMGLHLVSKGLDSPLFGSQQPIFQPELEKRLAEAKYVNAWVSALIQRSPQTIVVVAGDMNDGFGSQVLNALAGDVLVDASIRIESQARYSLINDGLATQFDHILISNNVPETEFAIYHINTINDESSQISDHDPAMVSIPLN